MFKRWLQKPVVLHSGCVKIGRCILCSAYYPRLSQVLSFRYAHPENTAITLPWISPPLRLWIDPEESLHTHCYHFNGLFISGIIESTHICDQANPAS